MWFESPLVTAVQLARRLRTSRKWVEEEARAGRLPHVAADKQLLFDVRVVDQILLERAGGGIPLQAAPSPAETTGEVAHV